MSIADALATNLPTIHSLRNDLQEVETQIAKAHSAEARIPALNTEAQRHQLDSLVLGGASAELVAAHRALRDAEALAATLPALRDRRQQLRTSIAAAEAEEHAHVVAEANQRMQALHNEFDMAARQCCRIYRQMLVVQRANSSIRGAHTGIVGNFHFAGMVPLDWAGTTAEQIRQGSLPWLTAEVNQ